nr:Chain A, peptide SD [synthetic construct]
ACLPWSDGPC